MNAQDEYLQLKDHWRSRVLAIHYAIVVIIFFAELVLFVTHYLLQGEYQKNTAICFLLYVLLPSVINYAAVVIAQYIQQRSDSEQIKSYAVVACALVVCSVISTINSRYLLVPASFVTVIIISCIMDDKKLMRVSAVLSNVMLFITGLLASALDKHVSLIDRWLNIFVAFVLISVVFYISESLTSYIEDKNDIIYQTSLTQERMRLALKKDAMTNLYNHSEFYHYLSESAEWSKDSKRPISVAMIDVNLFKSVNDTYGHENGDLVLLKIADILKSSCPEGGKAFRYGGEEFALIIKDMTGARTYDLVETIRKKILQERFKFMPGKHCSISSGIYEYNGEDMTGEEIFTKADTAMYKAKKDGRNRTFCCANR